MSPPTQRKRLNMDCPFLENPIDIEARIMRNGLRRERIFRPRLDVLSFPEEFIFERYRFSLNSIIYLNNLLRPCIQCTCQTPNSTLECK